MTCNHSLIQRGRRTDGVCYRCMMDEIQSTCAHSSSLDVQWAGVLGYRYYCSACGIRRPDPNEE